jgi:hypothetical protein
MRFHGFILAAFDADALDASVLAYAAETGGCATVPSLPFSSAASPKPAGTSGHLPAP